MNQEANEKVAAPAPVEQEERARFEAWSRRVAPAYGFDKDERGQYIAYPVHAGWSAWQARASLAAPASAAGHAALIGEALAVFDLMLDGCNDTNFGDFQNGHGEEIGPLMDALHAKLRAAVSGCAPASAEPAQRPQSNLLASINEAAEIAKTWPSWKTGIKNDAAPSVPGGESESVDTPKFDALLGSIYEALDTLRDEDTDLPLQTARFNLVAHINAHVARQVQAARDQALEEAARVCERVIDPTRINTTSAYSDFHAEAIRALKASPQEPASTGKGARDHG